MWNRSKHTVKKSILFMTIAATFCGCANTTAVLPASASKSEFLGAVYSGETVQLENQTPGAEVFRMFQQGATGFVSVAEVRADVEVAATKHCARKGKTVRPIQETASKPPHILGNFPRVEWLFECVDAPQTTMAPRIESDKLGQIERMKKLLDSGALTQQEFEREKAKVLASP